MCKDTLDAINKLLRSQNLVTGKPVYEEKLTFTAGESTNRTTIEVVPTTDTCGYVLRLANLPTIDGADDATVYFAIDSPQKAAAKLTALKTRAGLYIEAAGGISHVFEQDTRAIILDFAALGIDQATEATASIFAEVRPLIPLKNEKVC